MTYKGFDEFAGWGGSSQGLHAIPGLEVVLAANHKPIAVEVHKMNFPNTQHYRGDIREAEIERFERADFFWASPACPGWTDARGVRREFDKQTTTLFDDEELGKKKDTSEAAKSRVLMEEVPRYLRAMAERGDPVLVGAVENVVQVRKWAEWDRWLNEFRKMDYDVHVIALNAMHVNAPVTGRVPQSRDRAFVGYSHKKLGRKPDWNKWLRPHAYCPTCDKVVNAIQVFKNPRVDMGRYGVRHGQYVYRCPNVACRNQIVEPGVIPAVAAIDWSLPPGHTIGERLAGIGRALKPATIARARAGYEKYWRPLLTPAGGTWRDEAAPLDVPMAARTTRDNDGLLVPPLMVPCTGREGKHAQLGDRPLATQTCRQDMGMVLTPFIAELRGGGSRNKARSVSEPLSTFSANGNHHGLVGAGQIRWQDILMPYYGNGTSHTVGEPMGTLSTRDRFALVGPSDLPAFEDCTFRMLTPREVAAGMAFARDYQVKGTGREQVAGFGNAVPPPMAEVIGSALMEAMTGEELQPAADHFCGPRYAERTAA
jgi:DNA (cytosine-5)-methyltransferase 1